MDNIITFVMPFDENPNLEHAELRKDICLLAGGYTAICGTGGWFDPDLQEVVTDQIVRYEVAFPGVRSPVKFGTLEGSLRRIASHHAHARGEKTLYWVARGSASVITLPAHNEKQGD